MAIVVDSVDSAVKLIESSQASPEILTSLFTDGFNLPVEAKFLRVERLKVGEDKEIPYLWFEMPDSIALLRGDNPRDLQMVLDEERTGIPPKEEVYIPNLGKLQRNMSGYRLEKGIRAVERKFGIRVAQRKEELTGQEAHVILSDGSYNPPIYSRTVGISTTPGFQHPNTRDALLRDLVDLYQQPIYIVNQAGNFPNPFN